jgi:hypothetical protein
MTEMRTPDDFLTVLDRLGGLGPSSAAERAPEARAVLEALKAGVTPFPESRPGGERNRQGGWDQPAWARTMKEKRRSFFKLAVVAALWRIGEHVLESGDPLGPLIMTLVSRSRPVLREKSYGNPEKDFLEGYLMRAIHALDTRLVRSFGSRAGVGLTRLAHACHASGSLGAALSAAVSVETLHWALSRDTGSGTLCELASTLWGTWQSQFKLTQEAGLVVLPMGREYGAASLPLELHLRPLLAQVFDYKPQDARQWNGTLTREFTLRRLNRTDTDRNSKVTYHGRDILHVRYALLAEQLLDLYEAIRASQISTLGTQLKVSARPGQGQACPGGSGSGQ